MAATSDIRVDQIIFQPTILCNCPTTVRVILINRGNAAPIRNSVDGKFEVCLQSPDFRIEGTDVYRQRVGGTAEQGVHILLPGQTLAVLFRNVVFLRAGIQEVTACADCAGVIPHAGHAQFEIANDPHTQPCLKVKVEVKPAAWLRVDQLEIDLEDSLGNRNRNVTQLCPGSTYVAIATVSNLGCVPAQNFTARLLMLDQNGNVVNTIDRVVPVVNPLFFGGVPVSLEFRGHVPQANPAGAAYSFRVCLDVTNRIQPQCTRQLLCLSTSPIPVAQAGGPGPQVIFFVNGGPVYPGLPVGISWGIQDDCSDLGSVTARITLKATGDLLYDSSTTIGPIPVPPLAAGGEGLGGGGPPVASIRRPAATNVANALYQLGNKMLHIDISGTGRNPGPYSADTPLAIVAEPMDNWWAWDNPAPNLFWKMAYQIGGVFTNQTQSAVTFTVTAAHFTEFDDDAAPPAPTGQVFDVPASALISVAPAASSHFVWPNIIQNWTWVVAVPRTTGRFHNAVYVITGPLQRDFGYQAAIALLDEFGNAYRLAVRLDPCVFVPDHKRNNAEAAVVDSLGALVIFASAAIAFASGGLFGVIVGLALALTGGVLLGLASRNFLQALDPPVPDFQYLETVSVILPALPKALDELPTEFAALRSVAQLIDRIEVALDALGRIESKLLGARVDRNAEGIRIQVDGYRDALNLLTMATAQLPNASAETVQAFAAANLLPSEALLNETFAKWRSNGLPPSFRELWTKADLPQDALPDLEELLRSPKLPAKIPTVEAALKNVSDGQGRVAHNAQTHAATVLAGLEQAGSR